MSPPPLPSPKNLSPLLKQIRARLYPYPPQCFHTHVYASGSRSKLNFNSYSSLIYSFPIRITNRTLSITTRGAGSWRNIFFNFYPPLFYAYPCLTGSGSASLFYKHVSTPSGSGSAHCFITHDYANMMPTSIAPRLSANNHFKQTLFAIFVRQLDLI